ncbi:phage integrase central domain-containing protein [Bradyrhizobium oligotrophicum]|uniref:phage integrase central domain-containing protein n=1 Tax=Bradyrhizobium oligotrophicum TaxID=44255 RepID=UPI003EBA68AC
MGDRPLCGITLPELPATLRRVEPRGRFYTVVRLQSTASGVFQFGVGASYCSTTATRDLCSPRQPRAIRACAHRS